MSEPEVQDADQHAEEPAWRHADIGYAWLEVPDVERAVAFYGAVLGWRVGPGSLEQGRQVTGTTPSLGLSGGGQHATLNCAYAVADVDAAVERVRAAGGTAAEPDDRPYGRLSDCRDDDGRVFALYQPPGGVGEAVVEGADLAYTTFEVVDSGRFKTFYGVVLGWEFSPGGVPDGWQISTGVGGLQGGHPVATTLPMWRVDDIAATVDKVLAAGGTSSEVHTRPYGLEAECADDQGVRFYLGQL